MLAGDRANQFLQEEEAFRLGCLLTEASHPKTRTLSQTLGRDVEEGVRLLQEVDRDIVPCLDTLFAQPGYAKLVTALVDALSGDGRLFLTGCGATGRLSILLEAAWRRFWRQASPRPGGPSLEDRCVSVMAGGDYALIKSVEGFEDFPEFGRYHLRQAGVTAGDVVVAITEGGETPFVIGTAWEGLAAGAQVFFVYNNPTDLLKEHVERSREILEDPRIHRLELTTGPMAITGSTRMQATTAELLVVGAALEQAIGELLRQADLDGAPFDRSGVEDYRQRFTQLVTDLGRPDSLSTISRWVQYEEAVYRPSGLITYAADAGLLDVLTDTTERSPTFMLPAFRGKDDRHSPRPWAFVKNPGHDTTQTWRRMLQRPPRGLNWDREVYRALKAPPALREQPPQLDERQIHQFQIGNEADASRTAGPEATLMIIGFQDTMEDLVQSSRRVFAGQFARTALVSLGNSEGPATVAGEDRFHLSLAIPDSPLDLWRHLSLKLILNTVSTATMCRLDRVWGNAMVWVSPSNKKLIDRGCRLIAQTTDCTYEQACEQLFRAVAQVKAQQETGREVSSPVALAIKEIRQSGIGPLNQDN